MEIKVEITQEMLQSAVNKAIIEALERSYSNPIKDTVNEALKTQSGVIKEAVNKIIADAISSPEYQDTLKNAVIQKMVGKILDN